MASINDVKTKLKNVNALGIANLTEQGVELSASATTYEIMQGIAEIVSGGGSQYTSIVYNEDNTITLTDKDGVVHTMKCEYIDGKLTSVKYDGKAIALFYDEDKLVKVGKTEVDVANAPLSPKQNFKTTILADVITPQHNAVFVEAVNVNSITTTIESEVNT